MRSSYTRRRRCRGAHIINDGAPRRAGCRAEDRVRELPEDHRAGPRPRGCGSAVPEGDRTSTRRRCSRWATRCKTQIADYQKKQATMTPAARSGPREGSRRQAAGVPAAACRSSSRRAQQREAELVRPIMEQINKIIEQIRTENGYSFILDAGSQAGVVVAADSSLDITDQVIKRSQAAGPVAAKAPPAAPPATDAKPTGATHAEADRRVASQVDAVTTVDHSARDFNSLGGVSESALTAEAVAHLVGGDAAWRAVGARRARGGARPRDAGGAELLREPALRERVRVVARRSRARLAGARGSRRARPRRASSSTSRRRRCCSCCRRCIRRRRAQSGIASIGGDRQGREAGKDVAIGAHSVIGENAVLARPRRDRSAVRCRSAAYDRRGFASRERCDALSRHDPRRARAAARGCARGERRLRLRADRGRRPEDSARRPLHHRG